jgi:hypothetical protein
MNFLSNSTITDCAEVANPRASLPAAKRFLRQIQIVCGEGLDTSNPLLTSLAVDVLLYHCGTAYNRTHGRANEDPEGRR